MQEKLSVQKVYLNAYKYIATHFNAFAMLVFFYFAGSLLPTLLGLTSYRALLFFYMVYYYLFLYFATGLYYKKQFLLNKDIFTRASLRFLTVCVLFLAAVLVGNFSLSLARYFFSNIFVDGNSLFVAILNSSLWQICNFLFFFILFIIFFVIPSFVFVSEISEKSRSVLTAYAKVKGNILKIAMIGVVAYLLLLIVIYLASVLRVNLYVAELMRDVVFVFLIIAYFKMYDFFYRIPENKNPDAQDNKKEIKIATNKTKKTQNKKSGNISQA